MRHNLSQSKRIGTAETTSETPEAPSSSQIVIRTPAFIVIFALLFTVGLSLNSILSQGMLNGYYTPDTIHLLFTGLVLLCWLIIGIRTHSWLVRTGTGFGIIWSILALIGFEISAKGFDLTSFPLLYLNIASACALLGASICLSTAHTVPGRWDRWFFWLLPIAGISILAFTIFSGGAEKTLWTNLITELYPLTLCLALAVWWLRPLCWLTQAAPAIFFGAAILTCMFLPALTNREAHFFFTQIVLLSLLLALIRVLQYELHHQD
ncbi:hypothetical protein [Tengunoibacter tsumagoiensis]|uniref:Uncharacterized protein n=1 Tax=Tengunoibacter tsumagoiensis TaxID=2014871 RepID=A0A402A0D4_9CHLR|nr:hypothetical protein [Tengunoibacter tsumagoiensis]GCE12573.1 hypothetical protein KTT_24320 [Tengunoibacter tsumagoiensis]